MTIAEPVGSQWSYAEAVGTAALKFFQPLPPMRATETSNPGLMREEREPVFPRMPVSSPAMVTAHLSCESVSCPQLCVFSQGSVRIFAFMFTTAVSMSRNCVLPVSVLKELAAL